MFSRQYIQGLNGIPIVQPRYQTVSDVLPGIVPGLLGTAQLFLWIVIIILEIISIYYDAGRGTVYAGLWCSPIFFVTWLSMFCYLCCGKSSRCGTYLVVQNIINLIFAIILLAFTSAFVKNPCLCYDVLCSIPNWDDNDDDDHDDHDHDNVDIDLCNSRTRRKLPILKGLLACAVLMLVCNIIFIAIYLIASIRLRAGAKSNLQQSNVTYQQNSTAVQSGEQPSHYPSTVASAPHQQQQSYPVQYSQTPSQWSSEPPPPYEMCSERV